MTIAIAMRDRIVSDSRLTSEDAYYSVGKIFRLPDESLLSSAGDARLTYPFEKAHCAGEEPEPMEAEEDESFEGVVLRPDGQLILYNGPAFSPFLVADPFVVIGNTMACGVVRSWLKHGVAPEIAIARAIEVDPTCGGDIVTVMLHPNKGSRPPGKLPAPKKPRWKA